MLREEGRMKLNKLQTQVILIVLVLFQIRSVLYLIFYTWFLITVCEMVSLNVWVAQAALVYLLWIWIRQLNMNYYKKYKNEVFA